MRRAVLFDLDGTLTDPVVGITRSLAHALVTLGRVPPPADAMRWCIGPPLRTVLRDLLETDDPETIEAAVDAYRSRYAAVGKFENVLVDGIPAALEKVRAEADYVAVATSKLKTYAADIVGHFGLAHVFDAVHGSELDGANAVKRDLIRHILSTETLEAAATVMVGDRSHDVVGASANAVSTIGVRWGYAAPGELETAGAMAIAEMPGQLPYLVEAAYRDR